MEERIIFLNDQIKLFKDQLDIIDDQYKLTDDQYAEGMLSVYHNVKSKLDKYQEEFDSYQVIY